MEISGKPRIVIWFVSTNGRYIGDAVNILEQQHNGVIIGITATQKISIINESGPIFPYISLQELTQNGGGYDIILVAGAKNIGMSEVAKFARAIKLDTSKLLGDWIVCIPGFTLKKYQQLQRSKLSIFAQNCFGGYISNTLGLLFRSPFVNLWLAADDFLRFLQNPRIYIEGTPIFEKLRDKSNEAPNGYPVVSLGNIYLNMMHYPNADNALKKWNERKQRINWYNILVEMSTESKEILEQFDELPFSKKVCFVPFKSDLNSAFYMNPHLQKERTLGLETLRYARAEFPYYDMFDMLLYGKKTPLIEM